VSFYRAGGRFVNEDIELLRNNLERLILKSCNLTDKKVIMLSQELDKLIVMKQLRNLQLLN
jgi:hypothetical protein